ncbi:hypothetical protein DL96DRAFT_739202 [Flagelloscypha sp. PMI_526]|nr:hypothetical protein DL96DRAFT_739202 [Flagelloscypha sp. PMI_526]
MSISNIPLGLLALTLTTSLVLDVTHSIRLWPSTAHLRPLHNIKVSLEYMQQSLKTSLFTSNQSHIRTKEPRPESLYSGLLPPSSMTNKAKHFIDCAASLPANAIAIDFFREHPGCSSPQQSTRGIGGFGRRGHVLFKTRGNIVAKHSCAVEQEQAT